MRPIPIPDLPASAFDPTGGLVFASDGHRQAYSTPRNQLSPRIGVAYTPDALGRNTVFRGGFGVYYHTYGITGINRPGFAQTTEFVRHQRRIPAAVRDPRPIRSRTEFCSRSAARSASTRASGSRVTFYNPDTRPSYSRRYTVGLQQRLPAGMALEASYQYNQARGLPVNDNLNFIPASYLSTSPERDQATINRLTANVANPFAGLLPGHDAEWQHRPVPAAVAGRSRSSPA